MSELNKNERSYVISYLTLRRAVGILGVVLPVILVVGSVIACGCCDIQVSISNYYHTCMRNVFVGIMCAVGFFLFSYTGYDIRDNIAGHFGAIFAIGVALLPTSFKGTSSCLIHPLSENPLTGYLHLTSATLFFCVLIYFSLFLFTITKNPTPQKKKRNIIYRVCGYTMLGCILLIGVYILVLRGKVAWLDNSDPVFWFEAIALWAFGISWLTKGEVLLKDAEKQMQ